MNKKRCSILWVLLALVAAAIIPALACGLPSESESPTVVIVSPADGSTVIAGQQVLVQSSASGEKGIARVELLVNSVVVRVDPPAEGTPTTFAIAQPWMPEAPGDVVIHVIAYDTDDQASVPTSITLHVVESAAQVTPAPGPTQTPVPDVTEESGCTLNASYVADLTIPDDTELEPGVSFVKTWRIRNSGTCDWDTGFQLAFVGGSQLGASASVAVPATPSGSTVDVAVQMVAPTEPGAYKSRWRMQSDQGQVFGSTVYALIVVPEPATPTPTPTITPTVAPLAAPSGLTMTVLPGGYVSFVWVDNSEGEDGFRVLADGAIHASVGPDAQGYGFQSGEYFCDETVEITIVAYEDGQTSEPSNAVEYTGPSCPPPVVVQASGVTMALDSYLDLDTGALGDYDANVDLLWQANGDYRIVGMNEMQFANVGVGDGLPSYTACSSVSRTGVAIYVPALEQGTRLCFDTTEGNLAGFYVEEIQPDYDLVVSYVTWQGTP